MRTIFRWLGALAGLAAFATGSTALAQQPAPVSFVKDIGPLLVQKCQGCHGAAEPKSDYQVVSLNAVLKAGATGATIVTPGDVANSELYRLLASTEPAERMPKDADPLSAESLALVKRWIEEGAKFDGPDVAAPLVSYVPKPPFAPAPAAYHRTVPITAVAFRPDGQELAVGGYHEISIWNPADGSLLRRIANVEQRVFGLTYSPDGALLAAAGGEPGVGGGVRLYDPNTGALIKDLVATSDCAFDAQFNAAGSKLAACAADRSIRIFDVASGKQDFLIEDHADWVMGIAWNHDGTRLASASRDKTSKLFDMTNGESLATYPGHGEPVFGVAFSPDGAQVFTGGASKTIQLWNPADGNKIADIGGFGGEVDKVVIRAGFVFAACGDGIVRQFNVADRAAVRQYAGHADWVYALAFNETAKRLASGSFDGEVRIWNADDGALIKNFIAAPGYAPPAPAATTTAAK